MLQAVTRSINLSVAWNHDFERAFHPRAVAVVGATGSQRGLSSSYFGGASFIKILRGAKFEGDVYPVNPNASEVLGLRAYPDLRSLPRPADLVIVAVPATRVPQVLEECAATGNRNIHLFTSGFGELDDEAAKQLQASIAHIAQHHHLNILGPNCMGLHVPSSRLSTWDNMPGVSGPVALLSQSGGHAEFFTRYAREFGIGFSKAISYGNGLVMDSTDFLEYLISDPETRIICMYLEGVRDGPALLRLIRNINPRKPVIIWKGGLSAWGARAAASHTGSLAGQPAVWEAFFKQTGAVRVSSLDEMADVTMAFLCLPPIAGKRVAVVGGGGGNSVAAADVCAREGLEVPLLSPETRAELSTFVKLAGSSIKNPLDVEWVLTDLSLFRRTLQLLVADPVIDMIIIDQHLDRLKEICGPQGIAQMGGIIAEVAAQAAPRKALAAILYTWGTDSQVRAERRNLAKSLLDQGVPVFRSLPRAGRALGRFVSYHRFHRQP